MPVLLASPPPQVARVVVSVFVAMLYIAALNIFLTAIQCKPDHDTHVWKHIIYHTGARAQPWHMTGGTVGPRWRVCEILNSIVWQTSSDSNSSASLHLRGPPGGCRQASPLLSLPMPPLRPHAPLASDTR